MHDQHTLVVIENDGFNRDIVARIVATQTQVHLLGTWESGSVFFTWLQQMHPTPWIDLILLDIAMPYEDGFTILAQLRQHPMTTQSTIVAWTANVFAHAIDDYRAAGFNGYLGKPISYERFPDQLTRIFQGEAVWETY